MLYMFWAACVGALEQQFQHTHASGSINNLDKDQMLYIQFLSS
jgi:hypothetical protein